MSIFKVALVVLVLLLGYLLLLPVSIAPVAWTPTPVASLPPPTSLRAIQRIEPDLPDFVGPEGIAADTEGRIYAGLGDGRLLRLSADFGSCTLLDNSGGRPLGLAVSSDGALLIADARSGLLSLGRDGQLRTLSDRADGVAYGFTDDVTVTADGSMVYFTDASARFGFGQHMEDLLEHGRTGRLLRYDVATNKAETLMQDRAFANGVALGPDEAYVVFAETWEYKLTRYWLKGEKAGQSDTLVDGLPGFPDNLSFNGRDRFWVAIYSPRDPMLDRLLPHPALRKIVARLPEALRPRPARVAQILGIDLDGRIVANLRYDGDDAYGYITSVEEQGDYLVVGSLDNTALGRIKLQDALSSANATPPPPLRPACDAG